jgi:hypothetical protein
MPLESNDHYMRKVTPKLIVVIWFLYTQSLGAIKNIREEPRVSVFQVSELRLLVFFTTPQKARAVIACHQESPPSRLTRKLLRAGDSGPSSRL